MRSARRRDVMTSGQRSRCMAQIKRSNTKPELALRRALWKRGWRYQLRTRILGHPDLVFRKQRLVIFVDGCFWHGCKVHGVLPRSNRKFWLNKLRTNIKRDLSITKSLQVDGWQVLRFWEHEIEKDLGRVVIVTERELGKKK